MTIDIQHEHGHTAWTWTWSKDKYMLLIHVYLHAAYSCPFHMFQYIRMSSQYMLHDHVHPVCLWTWTAAWTCTDMYIVQCVQRHSAWTWSCSIDMQYGHGHAVNMDSMGLYMLHVQFHAAYPNMCCVSMPML
jgi:hypothetical protein